MTREEKINAFTMRLECRPGFALITYLCDAMGQPPSYVFAKGGYDEAL